MYTLLILVFILTTKVYKSAQTEFPHLSDNLEKEKIQKSAEEYVKIHMVDNLPNAIDAFATPTGKNWLESWITKRRWIFEDVIMYFDKNIYEYKLYSKWFQRLQLFQKYQTEYLQSIFQYSSEPMITFNPKTTKIDLYFDEAVHQTISKGVVVENNQIVTESDIDRVLRNHLPYSDEELKKLDHEETERVEKALSSDSKNFYEDINPKKHNANERKTLRSLIGKFEIINQKLIQDFLKIRYKLLRESLRNKQMLDLRYQERMLIAERICAQFDVWKRFSKGTKNFDQLSEHLKILTRDDEYRKYLNLRNTFFNGNIMYGYKNRGDNPINFKYDFELTSKTIIGKRFKPMYELFQKMSDFRYGTKNFEFCRLENLPTIDAYLENFKILTFNFEQSRFNKNQWLFLTTKTNQYRFPIVRPKIVFWKNLIPRFPNENDKIYEKVLSKFLKVKNHLVNNLPFVETPTDRISNFEFLTEKQFRILHEKKKLKKINEVIHYFDVMNNANLLSQQLSTFQSQHNSLEFHAEPEHLIFDLAYDLDDEIKHDKKIHNDEQNTKEMLENFKVALDFNNYHLSGSDKEVQSILHSNVVPNFNSFMNKNNFQYGTGGDVGRNTHLSKDYDVSSKKLSRLRIHHH